MHTHKRIKIWKSSIRNPWLGNIIHKLCVFVSNKNDETKKVQNGNRKTKIRQQKKIDGFFSDKQKRIRVWCLIDSINDWFWYRCRFLSTFSDKFHVNHCQLGFLSVGWLIFLHNNKLITQINNIETNLLPRLLFWMVLKIVMITGYFRFKWNPKIE